MKGKILKLIVFLFVFVAVAILAYLEKTGYFIKKDIGIVARVIDGDTFELESGERVRLLGIDAPEKDEFYFKEARQELEKLVNHKKVLLEKDIENVDRYGRLLRYVYADGIFVNLYLVKNGYANAYVIRPNVRYLQNFLKAEKEAREKGIGIWEKAPLPYLNCIKIKEFFYKGKNEEVTFVNNCDFKINLGGWKVKNSGEKLFIFPSITLSANESITLYSGFGKSSKGKLYWNENEVWDDENDILILRDNKNNLILTYRYP